MTKFRAKMVAVAAGLALAGGGGVAAATAANASTSHSGHASVKMTTHNAGSKMGRVATGRPVIRGNAPADASGGLAVSESGSSQDGIGSTVTSAGK